MAKRGLTNRTGGDKLDVDLFCSVGSSMKARSSTAGSASSGALGLGHTGLGLSK